MNQNWKQTIEVGGSPQIHSGMSTSSVMWSVSLALAPAAAWGIFQFGLSALWVLLLSIITSCGAEALLYRKEWRRHLADGSAFLTGLLIGFNMPPHIVLFGSDANWFVPVVASLFAIVVVKWTFGGLGANWMNPALAGRVFVFFSWTKSMTLWTLPSRWGVDQVTGATPLGSLKTGLMNMAQDINGPLELLASQGVPVSYKELFLGQTAGCIGEVSALLLLAGALFLFIRKIITWEIPLAFLASFTLMVWIFGGRRYGAGFFQGDVLFHLLSGGLMLGVFFMATDMVTSPLSSMGRIIFGIGCGLMTFLIRFYGSFPEGVSLAILFMNIFVPLIDRLVKTKRFGVVSPKKELKP